MSDSVLAAPAQTKWTMALGDALASRSDRRVALMTSLILITCAVAAATFGFHQGPQMVPLVPMAASCWSIADLLTAFLLFAQFYVNGRLSIAILATAYALSGFLTAPYLLAFPGLFLSSPTLGEQQISLYLWITWHCSFPIIVTVATLNESAFRRVISRVLIHRVTVIIAGAALFAACAITVLVIGCRDALPRLIVDGHFQPLYRLVVIPLIITLNATICTVFLRRGKRLTTLQLWLGVAMLASCLDGGMNLSATRYSYAWDAGKGVTVFAASIVLMMLLSEIVRLYARLDLVARIDQLTGLPNRRAYDEHMQLVYHYAQRVEGSMGLLMIDLDRFKLYNDTFGHAAGDQCLQTVARAIATCATRPLDLVARYGGEELVVILPDTSAQGAELIAERVRRSVETLTLVPDPDLPPTSITVSIGVGFAENVALVSQSHLFDNADQALYRAKEQGRNRVVLGAMPAASGKQRLLATA